MKPDQRSTTWTAPPELSCAYLGRAVHPDDLLRWLEACVKAFDAREPFEVEYRLRGADGAWRWVRDRGRPRYAPDGRFLGFTGTCVDLAPRVADAVGV